MGLSRKCNYPGWKMVEAAAAVAWKRDGRVHINFSNLAIKPISDSLIKVFDPAILCHVEYLMNFIFRLLFYSAWLFWRPNADSRDSWWLTMASESNNQTTITVSTSGTQDGGWYRLLTSSMLTSSFPLRCFPRLTRWPTWELPERNAPWWLTEVHDSSPTVTRWKVKGFFPVKWFLSFQGSLIRLIYVQIFNFFINLITFLTYILSIILAADIIDVDWLWISADWLIWAFSRF